MISTILGRGGERHRPPLLRRPGRRRAWPACSRCRSSTPVGAPSAIFLAGAIMAATGAVGGAAHAARGSCRVGRRARRRRRSCRWCVPDEVPIPIVDDFKTQIVDGAPQRVERRVPRRRRRVRRPHPAVPRQPHRLGDLRVGRRRRQPRPLRHRPALVPVQRGGVARTRADHRRRRRPRGARRRCTTRPSTIDAVELNPVTHSPRGGRVRRLHRRPRRARDDVELAPGRRPLVPQPHRRRATTSSGTRRPTATPPPTPPPPGRSCCRRATCTRSRRSRRASSTSSDDGLLVAQFGEQNFAEKPNRTARYVSTARAALDDRRHRRPVRARRACSPRPTRARCSATPRSS